MFDDYVPYDNLINNHVDNVDHDIDNVVDDNDERVETTTTTIMMMMMTMLTICASCRPDAVVSPNLVPIHYSTIRRQSALWP